MTTANYDKQPCPVARTLAVLGDQWTLLIVRDALSGIRRFSEFHASLGLSRNLLTRRLNQLCVHGVLAKVPIPGSRRFAYEPTPKCLELRTVILAMAQWGERWRGDADVTRVEVVDSETGAPVRLGFYREDTGELVAQDQLRVHRRHAVSETAAPRAVKQ